MNMKNKMELIHIECGRFNGIALYKFNDKVIRFELGTPEYNDYGEYRIDVEFPTDEYDNMTFDFPPYDKDFKGNVPTPHTIKLDEQQFEWWNGNGSHTFYYVDPFCGIDENNVIHVYTFDSKCIPYDEWLTKEHTPYEHVILSVVYMFYKYYNSDDFQIVSNGLLVYF